MEYQLLTSFNQQNMIGRKADIKSFSPSCGVAAIRSTTKGCLDGPPNVSLELMLHSVNPHSNHIKEENYVSLF